MPARRIDNFLELWKWEEKIEIGSNVIVRWTSSGYDFHTTARVTKLNRKSICVCLTDGVPGTNPGFEWDYPAGQTIRVPRIDTPEWSWNNGVFPAELL